MPGPGKHIYSALFICLGVLIGGQTAMAQDIRQLEQRIRVLEQKVEHLETMIEMLRAGRMDPLVQLTPERTGSGMTSAEIDSRRAIGQAKANLATIKNGLGMFQAESDYSAYPGSSDINSYNDIRRILSPYLRLPAEAEAGFTFMSYVSERPDDFTLTVRAPDHDRTTIVVTPTTIRDIPPSVPAQLVRPADADRPVSPQRERGQIERAMAELASVRTLLGMFQAENDGSAYPETVTIQNYQSLAEVLSPYGMMSPAGEASWTFVSYARPAPNRFLMTARARDTDRSVIWISPTGIELRPPPGMKEQ